MSVQNPSSNHCSRTYWTPTMERYFIDLMLEHVHRGNRTGHTFNKQAWIDMLSVFNAKFGSQYDKDVLKSRYTAFTYIKIHPEAKSYRTKSVLNFDDLCLIYGYTVADGRYSRSSHDVDVEDEVQELNFGDCNSSLAPSSSSRTEWTLDMDQYFMELMLKQQERGFCWDEKREMVVVYDDVWDAYIKGHPHARLYRGKVFTSYNNLALIFGEMFNMERKSEHCQDIKIKAVVARCGGERSRTYWTPPMDRFLIDLMVEQVRRGNRIGQSFITQAWNDIVELFNVNFNSHHDREVLKNRYKHFRKQYNDVRIILRHNGFSWDKDREMVKAEDHVWDAYIKDHPDARSYRVKTVTCYHKLCVIYGQDKFEGSSSCLLDIGDSSIGISGNRKEEVPDDGENQMIEWTLPMEQYLVDLMLEQVRHGNKIDSMFIDEAWAYMTMSFKEKYGIHYEQHILENQYLNLMEQYIEISNLLNQEGFSWDEASHMIVAGNGLWESHARDHPEAIPYKDKVIEHYSELCTIFGSELVDRCTLNCDVPMEFAHPTDIKVDEYSGELPVTFLDSEIHDQVKKRPPPTSIALEQHDWKAQKIGDEEEQGDFTSTSNVYTELVNKDAGNNYFAIENAIDALQAIPDIDDELLLDCCDLLEDERKAKTFLALDAALRKKWLLRKLGRS